MTARAALLAVVLALASVSAAAQGCSQCRETVGQTPARTQSGYRRGIAVLGLAAAGLFTATLLVSRRFSRAGEAANRERPDQD